MPPAAVSFAFYRGVLLPPFPGRQAVPLFKGLGKMELVGVAAPAGNVPNGVASHTHLLCGLGQTQADDKLLGRTADDFLEQLTEITAVELAGIGNLLHSNAPLVILLDKGHRFLDVEVPEGAGLILPPGGRGTDQLIQKQAQMPYQVQGRIA